MSSNAKTGARNSQTSLTQGAIKASDYMKSKMATNTSELASDQLNLRSMMVRKDDEPTIDFQLEQEMIDLNLNSEKEKQPDRAGDARPAASKGAGMKNNLNESSDFDLDNI